MEIVCPLSIAFHVRSLMREMGGFLTQLSSQEFVLIGKRLESGRVCRRAHIARGSRRSRLRISHAIFGDRTFRIRVNGKWRHSVPLFDAVMVAVDTLADDKRKLIANRGKIRKALLEQTEQEDIYEIIVGKPNTAKAVKQRISIVHDLLRKFC